MKSRMRENCTYGSVRGNKTKLLTNYIEIYKREEESRVCLLDERKMRAKKGYSMIVLVVAITVILILASSTISVLQISREKTSITNFIFDITTVEEEVQDFYTRTGTLPTKTLEQVDIEALNNTSPGILSQLSPYDNESYYYIDLSQLGTVSLKDSERGYLVNEGSLKVYVTRATKYSNFDDEDTKIDYYTLTSNLVKGLEPYVSQEEEVLIVGNPVTWSAQANLRLVLPRRSLNFPSGDTGVNDETWKDWIFKWDFGPKTEVEMAAIPDDHAIKSFEYGDILQAKSNGIYTIYMKSPEGEVTLVNVNVNKIDDIRPVYRFVTDLGEVRLEAIDNETGIKRIRYKTLAAYKKNIVQAQIDDPDNLEGRTSIDYYLIDGEGSDLIYTLPAEIENFIKTRDAINKALQDETERYNRWLVENDLTLFTPEEIENERSKHEDLMIDLNHQLTDLNENYPYLKDIYGGSEDSRIVLYIEDYAGNATVVGENDFISTEILSASYNISLEGL